MLQTLYEQLHALPAGQPDALRPQVLACVAAWRAEKLEAARLRFEKDGDARALLLTLTGVMDEAIGGLFSLLSPSAHGVAVIATGGYGRREMFPHSDVDLLFLYRPAARGAAERIARYMLYVLWDLGLKVGHALRGVEDTLALALEDLTIRTNLLDARLVVGDGALFAQFQERYATEIVANTAESFVEKKLAECDERHRRLMDSRYLLEPNIKESKGGLRDLHTLYWIARYVYGIDHIHALVELGHITEEEYETFEKARDFLWQLRAHLHYVAGKPEERLTFDRQQAIAPRMGYRDREGAKAVEKFMKRYFTTAGGVGAFTRIVCALLEESHKRKPRQPLAMRLNNLWKLEGFTLDGERLQVKHADEFTREPIRMLRLFALAQKHGYDIHPRALQLVSRSLPLVDKKFQEDARTNAAFLEILLSPKGPEQALRRMNEVGLLGKFIPEFGRITGQMQFNMYHIYTVDEHIIVALGILHALERGALREEMPLATEAAAQAQPRKVLFFSLLCHDLGKAKGDQCEEGAKIALKLAKRFGFSKAEQELSAWLVGNHLLFTATAFKRDANDPQTVQDFVGSVQTVARLRLLLALTVADVRAVGPGVWNAWKATLLRNLYRKAEECMRTGTVEGAGPREQLRQELQAQLPLALPHEVEEYLALGAPEYIAGLTAPQHARVLELLARVQAEQLPLVLDVQHNAERSITTLTVLTPDRHALFSNLAGAISLVGANILTAKIFTLKNGMAVDMFHVQDQEGKAFDQPDRLARMSVKMRQVVGGEIDIARELSRQKTYASRKDTFQMQGQVFIENEVSGTHTVVEVVGRDRVGFLFAVTRALSEAGVTIGSAHISTYGAQAVDVFYIKDAFGLKITHEKKMHDLRAALLSAIGEGAE